MTTLARLALLAPVLLAPACSDDDTLAPPEVTYSISFSDPSTSQPTFVTKQVRLDEAPVVKEKLAVGVGTLDAGPAEGGYQISILDDSGAARLRVLCQKSDITGGSQTFSATLPDNSRYTVSISEDGARCDEVE